MLGVVRVDSPDILEELAICLIGEALDQPVNCWVEQTLILGIVQLMVPCLHNIVVQLEHILDHEKQVVLVRGVDSVSDSG